MFNPEHLKKLDRKLAEAELLHLREEYNGVVGAEDLMEYLIGYVNGDYPGQFDLPNLANLSTGYLREIVDRFRSNAGGTYDTFSRLCEAVALALEDQLQLRVDR